MSKLQEKSDILLESASVLNENKLFPAVAHCSYYACYQRIIHIWIYEMDNLNQDSSVLNGNGSHNKFITDILTFIKNSSHLNKNADFHVLNSKIFQLKRLRVKADYKDTEFDSISSLKAIDLSNTIIPILRKYQ